MPTGIYIHIPFCKQKCFYCDFLSFEDEMKDLGGETFVMSYSRMRSERNVNKSFPPNTSPLKNFYVAALVEEIKAAVLGAVDTVYIGGGTPTALPSFLLCEILEAVNELPLQPNAEITVEANPCTITPEYLAEMKARGVTRLSIGLQTTHSHLLRSLGRIHTKQDFLQNYHAAREAGFDNINVDLMFALPSQTENEWHETLEEIIALAPEHISTYSLTPAENTPLWEQIERDQLTLPTDIIDRNMYHTARKLLTQAGYTHYEISNFAKPNRESRHNINCWTMKPYLGFGLGAHSFANQTRWHNTENLQEYLTAPPNEKRATTTQLTPSDLQSEAIILGLRLTNGIPDPQTHAQEITNLINEGLLTRHKTNISLTPRGLDLANRVFTAFL